MVSSVREKMANSPVSSKSSDVTAVLESSGRNLYSHISTSACIFFGDVREKHTLRGLKVETMSLTFWVGRLPAALASVMTPVAGIDRPVQYEAYVRMNFDTRQTRGVENGRHSRCTFL